MAQGIRRRAAPILSLEARNKLAKAQRYPGLGVWTNPLTRGLARRLADETWRKTLEEIDFPYWFDDLTVAGVPCVRYRTARKGAGDALIIYIHGGGFVAGSPRANAATILPVCRLAGIEALGVDYTLLPEGRFPAAINEVDKVYRRIIARTDLKRIFFVSDSAGGAITLASLLGWRDAGLRLPDAAVFLSPMVDGAAASDTHYTLDSYDPLARSEGGRIVRKLFEYYAPGFDLRDPAISPIYGNLSNLPPILLQCGSREVFLGDSARLSEAIRRAGGDSMLSIFDGMFHLFQMHWSIGEAKRAHEEIVSFLARWS